MFTFSGLFWPGPFFPSFRLWIPKAVQRSALCRSRRELSNAYLLAKIGVDSAENEPCKVCPLYVYRSPRCVSICLCLCASVCLGPPFFLTSDLKVCLYVRVSGCMWVCVPSIDKSYIGTINRSHFGSRVFMSAMSAE